MKDHTHSKKSWLKWWKWVDLSNKWLKISKLPYNTPTKRVVPWVKAKFGKDSVSHITTERLALQIKSYYFITLPKNLFKHLTHSYPSLHMNVNPIGIVDLSIPIYQKRSHFTDKRCKLFSSWSSLQYSNVTI